MPVQVHADVRHLDQQEFGRIAYEVMDHVFAVHNDMGRFFDESIYRDALAARLPQSRTEVLVEVVFEDFRKDYYLDLLVDDGAVFELKAVRSLGAGNRAQLLNYLLLTGLSHGKLVNFRRELVEHEFVNTRLTLDDRTAFRVAERNWQDPGRNERSLQSWLLALLRDVGAGLDTHLYESAVSQEIDILAGNRRLGRQSFRLSSPDWAFKVTSIDDAGLTHFEKHARRFLTHTALCGLHWINITRKCVTFSSIEK